MRRRYLIVWKHDTWKLADDHIHESMDAVKRAIDGWLGNNHGSYMVRVIDVESGNCVEVSEVR